MWFFISLFGVKLLVGLAVLLSGSTAILLGAGRPSPIRPTRLLLGYIGAFLGAIIVSACMGYVSREDALKFGVRPEFYWSALIEQFATTAIYVVYSVVLGTAVVGAPIIYAMTRAGFGSIGWILAASIAISIAFLLLLFAVGIGLPLSAMTGLIGAHLLITLLFGFGVGLPLFRPRPYTRAPAT